MIATQLLQLYIDEMEPIISRITLSEFNRKQLPEQHQSLQGEAFANAVVEFLRTYFHDIPGHTEISLEKDYVVIVYHPDVLGADDEIRLHTAVDHFSEGKHEHGRQIMTVLIQRYPQNSLLHYNFARSFLDTGEWSHAIKHLREAVSINPFFSRAHTHLSFAHAALDEMKQALYHARLAVYSDETDYYALRNLAGVLSITGNMQDSEHFYRRALSLEDGDSAGLTGAAVTFYARSKVDQSIELLERAFFLAPPDSILQRMSSLCAQLATSFLFASGPAGSLNETEDEGKANQDTVDSMKQALVTLEGKTYREVLELAISTCLILLLRKSPQKGITVDRLHEYLQSRQPTWFLHDETGLRSLLFCTFQVVEPGLTGDKDWIFSYNQAIEELYH